MASENYIIIISKERILVMNMKKIASVVLALALSVSVFAACGSNGNSSASSTASTESSTASTDSSTASTDSSAAATGDKIDVLNQSETMDVSVAVMTGFTAADSRVQKELEEKYNVKFNLVVLPGWADGQSQISLLMASNDMPNIMWWWTMDTEYNKWVKAGLLDDVSAYMDKYTVIRDYYNKMDPKTLFYASEADGSIYRIPGDVAEPSCENLWIRQDWLDNLNLKAPTTIEELNEVLRAFTEDDPDGNGANDTYGLEMCKYTGPWDIIQTWFGCGNGWVEQDGKLVPVHQTAEYKEALDWMRKIYADGLVRPDWATVDTANFQVDTQKGVTGVFVDTMDGSKRIWKYFEDNSIADVNDASKIATMTSVGPINGHTLATTGYNGFYLITKSGAKTEEDVKACLHFLDKMCDPEMMALADYGLKDICYDINADGKVVPNGKYDTTNCPNAGLNQAVPYVPYLTEQNPDYQLEKADYQLAYEESIANNVQYAVFNPALGYLTQSDTYAECGNDLVQILDDARTQYICGQIDEAGLQAAFDQWNARGGTQVVEEVNALYAADKA